MIFIAKSLPILLSAIFFVIKPTCTPINGSGSSIDGITGEKGIDVLSTGSDFIVAITVSILNLYTPYTDPGTKDNVVVFLSIDDWINVQLSLSILLYKLYV